MGDRVFRTTAPVTLAEQLVAWAFYRDGDSVTDIADRLRRYPRQTRGILFGDPS